MSVQMNSVSENEISSNSVRYKFLEDGGNPNMQIRDGVTLLCDAIDGGQVEMVRRLLEAGAYPNFRCKNGKLPLYLAINSSKPESLLILQLLIQRNVLVNSKNIDGLGNTALLMSVWQNDVSKMEMLMKAGASLHDYDFQGYTVLHVSALNGNREITQMLLDAGVSADITVDHLDHRLPGVQPIHLTVEGPDGGHDQIAKLLLESGACPNAVDPDIKTTLFLAVEKNAYRVVDVLINHKMCKLEPLFVENFQTTTPLIKAIELGHWKIVNKLITAIVKPDISFKVAIYSCRPLVVKYLIQVGYDFDLATTIHDTQVQMSLRHAPHITEMLLLAGCRSSVQCEIPDYSPISLFPDVCKWLRDASSKPRSLKSLSRIAIRRALQFQPIQSLDDSNEIFFLPLELKDFLSFKELDRVLLRYSDYLTEHS